MVVRIGLLYLSQTNKEITYEMQQRLIAYYKTIYTIDPENIQQVTNVLQQVMDIDTAKQNGLPTLLQDLYNSFKNVIQGIHLVSDQS